jgi:hypothetical protein
MLAATNKEVEAIRSPAFLVRICFAKLICIGLQNWSKAGRACHRLLLLTTLFHFHPHPTLMLSHVNYYFFHSPLLTVEDLSFRAACV